MNHITPNFKVPRVRSKRYMDWLAKQPCVLTGAADIARHHLTCGPELKARSETASDIYALPLLATLHGPGFPGCLHGSPLDERTWWSRRGVPDPVALCVNHLAAYAAETLGAPPTTVDAIRRGAVQARVRARASTEPS